MTVIEAKDLDINLMFRFPFQCFDKIPRKWATCPLCGGTPILNLLTLAGEEELNDICLIYEETCSSCVYDEVKIARVYPPEGFVKIM